ncbi:MAG: lytic transglycosylase domain-containing protein [Bacteroidales bacterium]|nr:lytic transglycosylase domain-containing protein [Bacteroidales bacterium]
MSETEQTAAHSESNLSPSDSKRLKLMKRLSIIAICLSAVAIVGQIFVFATDKSNDDEIYRKALQANYRVYSPVIPDTVDFCGEKVPLNTFYVKESLDREILSNTYFQSNMMLCLKRANRYFPIIEPILKKNGVPDDFKYLAVIESNLTNATSPAKAQGIWQFMKATATSYGMEVNDDIDMRNNIEVATEAACKYLKSAYNRFGSWTSAAASYNCGEGGLNSRLTSQGVRSYYDVRINAETSRYVYRIIAVKLIMSHPQQFGYYVRKCDLYPQIPTRTVELSGQNVNLVSFAKQNGTTYKMLRELNPWLVNDKVTNKMGKTYQVKIPKDNKPVRERSTAMVTHM